MLLLVGDDVADLAARTMAVAKRRNLPTQVAFGTDRTGGTVEIEIRVAAESYAALVFELLGLTGASRTELREGEVSQLAALARQKLAEIG